MPGDPPMRRLRDPVRRTVRRLGWAVGAGTRRLGARTWPGAGGRTDSQPRPEQQGKRDPVTLPCPDLPIVLLSHRGPVSFGRDESGRTASRGAGGLVTALIGADAGPSRRRLGMRGRHRRGPRCGWRARPPGVRCHLEHEPRLLDQAELASQERQVPSVRLRLVEVDRQAPRRCVHGDRQPAWSTSWTCVGC
jgi:hypothetical protein